MTIGGCSDTLEGKTSSSIICNGPQMLNEYGAVYHSIHYDLNLENAEMYMLDKNKEVLFSPGGNEARFELRLSVFPSRLIFIGARNGTKPTLEIDRKTLVELSKSLKGSIEETNQCQTLD